MGTRNAIMSILRLAFGVVLGIVTGGCTPSVRPPDLAAPTPQLIHEQNFELGKTQTAFVGEPVAKAKHYFVLHHSNGMRATQNFMLTGGLSSASVNVAGTVDETFPIVGSVKVRGEDCPAIRFAGSPFVFGILPDGRFSGVVTTGDWGSSPVPGINQYRVDPSGTRFERVTTRRVLADAPYANYELVFTGMSSDTLHLPYREYTVNDLIRPAFSEQLTYPVTAEVVRYRNLRIAIQKASPEKLTYTVLEDGSGPQTSN